jgi:hypothetical protein
MLGFKPRTVHPLDQPLHPVRYAGSIQTPDSPSPRPAITPSTLCRFHSTLAEGYWKDKLIIQQRNPKDSRIDLLTFGTVPFRNLLSRSLRLKPRNLQSHKLTV